MVRDDHLFVPSNPFITRSNQKEFSVWIITTFLSRKDDKKEKKNQLRKQCPPFGPKICLAISLLTLFFLRSKQFSDAELKEN